MLTGLFARLRLVPIPDGIHGAARLGGGYSLPVVVVAFINIRNAVNARFRGVHAGCSTLDTLDAAAHRQGPINTRWYGTLVRWFGFIAGHITQCGGSTADIRGISKALTTAD